MDPKVRAAGDSVTRRFLMTQITPAPGDYAAQVHFEAFPFELGERVFRTVYSEQVNYRVHGEATFERDNLGLILYEEAVNVAAAAAPDVSTIARAVSMSS